MEPDVELYKPFLEPLISIPGVRHVPQSGIVWNELNKILSPEYLPYQIERAPNSPEATQRNDTLLVTANFALFPKRRFQPFESIAQLVIYQILSSIRTSSLFQKYGLVRMLIWAQDGDKGAIVPRMVQMRRRTTVELELCTDWVHEVVFVENPEDDSFYKYSRASGIDQHSAIQALQRMRQSEMTIPAGRESRLIQTVQELARQPVEPFVLSNPDQLLSAAIIAESGQREARDAGGKLSAPRAQAALKQFRRDIAWRTGRNAQVVQLLAERDAIAALKISGAADPETIAIRETAWNEAIGKLDKSLRDYFRLVRDNVHVYQQTPPVLQWDRRAYEPLVAKETEFFPNVPCTLFDIQPKAMDPLFRTYGPNSSRSGDYFELLLRGIMSQNGDDLERVLDGVWMAAGESIVPKMETLRDPAQGGTVLAGTGTDITPRVMNSVQQHEMLQRWMEWPFRPAYMEFIGRTGNDDGGEEAPDDTMKWASGGGAF
jgi:hypothetical protein